MITNKTYKRILMSIVFSLFTLAMFGIYLNDPTPITTGLLILVISWCTGLLGYISVFFVTEPLDDVEKFMVFFSFIPVINILLTVFSIVAIMVAALAVAHDAFKNKFVKD